MEALQVYVSTAYRRDIKDLTVVFIHLQEPKVAEPDKPEESENPNKKGSATIRASTFDKKCTTNE